MPAGGIKPFAGVLSPPVPELPLSDTVHHMSDIHQSLVLTQLRTRVKRQDRPGKTSLLCAFVFYTCHASQHWRAEEVSYGKGLMILLAKLSSQEVFLLLQ